MLVGVKEACSLEILSPKKFRKVLDNDGDCSVVSEGHGERESRVFRVFQSLCGFADCLVMSVR